MRPAASRRHAVAVAASGDGLYLGRLLTSVQDDELQLIATWWDVYRDTDVLISAVLDVREIGN